MNKWANLIEALERKVNSIEEKVRMWMKKNSNTNGKNQQHVRKNLQEN